ncbi:MAG: RNA pyrophosphohydrolase [Legionellales bacterium RIFCSPHIGHO2_12_FULL_42_9]|nr:MAG: RNA pyrophosphohydrolase [Legionellales bacterium RIFCSPHIGHO2_12_FULL_42_9]
MIIDRAGYRLNVGIILVNDSNLVFLGRRNGHDTWQFPQGGLASGETPLDAMHRELHEEVGLDKHDITVLGHTKRWLKYRLPKHYIRHSSYPLVIGQKQKWYLLRLLASDQKIRLDLSNAPEFDSWRWVNYNEPPQQVIFFKRQVYTQAMQELEYFLKKRNPLFRLQKKRRNKC